MCIYTMRCELVFQNGTKYSSAEQQQVNSGYFNCNVQFCGGYG